MKDFVLASASPRRKELLTQLGIKFRTCASKKEEEILRNIPEDIVKNLSYTKARDVYERGNRDAIVIGADTIVVFDEEVFGKPKNEEEAFAMIKKIQGTVHQVYTGVTIIWQQNNNTHVNSFVSVTDVEVYYMTDEEIRKYVSLNEHYDKARGQICDTTKKAPEWADKAGGYAIQGTFAKYVKRINGDYYNVVGLPISRLYQELKNIGAI